MLKLKKLISFLPVALFSATILSGCGSKEDKLVLRILNSEDYIYEYEEGDEEEGMGGFDKNGDPLCMDMVDQFIKYWADTHNGEEIDVIYDTFDTNETMFNELKTGKTTYDVCIPSDYMIQKLLANDMLHKFTDENIGPIWENISPFLIDIFEGIHAFDDNGNDKGCIYDYTVPYMWGTMGIMYNPAYYEDIPEEELHELMRDWDSLYGEQLSDSFSIKDSVRDSYAVSLIHTFAEEIANCENNEELTAIFNRNDAETIEKVKADMELLKKNAFGFETDSGKTDMTTQKIGANMCWSGDATWAITEARDLDLDLYYSIPTSYQGEELKGASNIWSDCFCMPNNDAKYETEEEALRHYKLGEEFIKFMSTPEIAVQNCYCVGYTPAVGGGDMLDYMRSCYDVFTLLDDAESYKLELDELIAIESDLSVKEELQEELDDVVSSIEEYNEIINNEDYCEYSLHYFFGDCDGDEVLYSSNDMAMRELKAQYPSEEELDRLAIMNDFGTEGTMRVLDMWEQVRTNPLPVWAIVVISLEIIAAISLGAYFLTKKLKRKNLKKLR